MTQVTWIIHEQILERLVYHGRSLRQAVQDAGHQAVVVSWEHLQPQPNVVVGLEQPVVLFGSHPFVRTINSGKLYQPGALGVNDRTSASAYLTNLPEEWFLNSFSYFMTWGMFKWRLNNLPSSLPWNSFTGKLFIRPNSGLKTFAGQVLNLNKDLDLDVKTIDENSSVMPETMCLVSGAVELEGEFRFVIADGQVIAGSEYRWDGKLDVRRDWPASCEDLASQVAQHNWQVDIAYTCDVALVDGQPKIVELNGFSCAGLYACDIDKVVRGVSQAAIKEFNGSDL